MGLFIPANKLDNLKLYKYSSEDHSMISQYVLKKWWNWFVQIFPLSMAPNLVTLMGLGFVLANLACVFYYDPYLDAESPRWCYFFYAFGLFMYQTFDGCDGCHARRTGQSGPLGELFDHSVDAINTSLGAIVLGSVLNMGYGWLLFIGQFASVCNFYASTWEEYHTHTLFLSSFSGPVEGVLMMCAVYVFTGFFGPGVYKTVLLELDLSSIGIASPVNIDITTALAFVGLGSLYFNIASAMANVRKKYQNDNRSNPAKAKTQTQNAYIGLVPFFVYYASNFALVLMYPEMMSTYGLPSLIATCCTIAFSVGRIILAHLTLQPFPMTQYPMFLPTIQIVLVWFLTKVYSFDYFTIISAVSWLGCGITVGIHAMFIVEIIYEITTYLDIYVLSIKHKRS